VDVALGPMHLVVLVAGRLHLRSQLVSEHGVLGGCHYSAVFGSILNVDSGRNFRY